MLSVTLSDHLLGGHFLQTQLWRSLARKFKYRSYDSRQHTIDFGPFPMETIICFLSSVSSRPSFSILVRNWFQKQLLPPYFRRKVTPFDRPSAPLTISKVFMQALQNQSMDQTLKVKELRHRPQKKSIRLFIKPVSLKLLLQTHYWFRSLLTAIRSVRYVLGALEQPIADKTA